MKIKQFRMKPPYFVALLVMLSWLIDRMFPRYSFNVYPGAGMALIIFALLIIVYSASLFRKNKTPIVPGTTPEFFITEGAYKLSRNPIYFSMVIFLIGTSLLFQNSLTLISPIAFFFIINKYYVLYEENLMEQTFGKKYLSYKKQVRRWI
ncbi:MAG: isoprenylcysteine carboxylmethyltransferase family protein [Nanoarchaeota archaeon]